MARSDSAFNSGVEGEKEGSNGDGYTAYELMCSKVNAQQCLAD